VWAPLGPAPLQRFLDSYRRHGAGTAHRLLVVFNGFSDGQDLAPWRAPLADLEHEELRLERPLLDLAAYREAAERIPAQQHCFVNSHSVILHDNWLGSLADHLSEPGVGIVGVAGSFESAYSAAPFWLRRRRRRDFPPFPNPHLRSNGFMLERELMLDLDWPAPRSKAAAWALESGSKSISRQVWDRGLEVLVVGRDGVPYPPARWRESATFRGGDQSNLLIADNRTRQYQEADPTLRRRLEEMAWGNTRA
jgi:hypothetical protein